MKGVSRYVKYTSEEQDVENFQENFVEDSISKGKFYETKLMEMYNLLIFFYLSLKCSWT